MCEEASTQFPPPSPLNYAVPRLHPSIEIYGPAINQVMPFSYHNCISMVIKIFFLNHDICSNFELDSLSWCTECMLLRFINHINVHQIKKLCDFQFTKYVREYINWILYKSSLFNKWSITHFFILWCLFMKCLCFLKNS